MQENKRHRPFLIYIYYIKLHFSNSEQRRLCARNFKSCPAAFQWLIVL